MEIRLDEQDEKLVQQQITINAHQERIKELENTVKELQPANELNTKGDFWKYKSEGGQRQPIYINGNGDRTRFIDMLPKMTSSSLKQLSVPESEDNVWLEYVYVRMSRVVIQSKTYIVKYEPKSVKECPVMCGGEYEDDSGTDPALELALTPVAMFKDPFRQGKHKIVLCQLDHNDGRTLNGETRNRCRQLLENSIEAEPWFGFEQTYFFVDEDNIPYDWDLVIKNPMLDTTCAYFAGKNAGKQRQMAEMHVQMCLDAGLEMGGMNREMSPSQWEYQLGPLSGISAPDQLVVSRFILIKLAEMHGLVVSFFDLECMKGTSARSMLHTNFSTNKMRDEGGLKHIEFAIENISKHSQEDILKFYDMNKAEDHYKWRLSGPYMPQYDNFKWEVGNKYDTSIRIPAAVAKAKKGYFEERRPSGEADPYEVCRVLTAAALLKSYRF